MDETKTVKGKETITITGNQDRATRPILDLGNQIDHAQNGQSSTELNMGNQSTNVDLGKINMRRCSRSR